jgi:hypothetical protein
MGRHADHWKPAKHQVMSDKNRRRLVLAIASAIVVIGVILTCYHFVIRLP